MLESLLTEGARRALEAATIVAAREGAAQREPAHLLWVLAVDESQAADVLKRAGATQSDLESAIPLRSPILGIEELAPSVAAAAARDSISDSDAFRRALAFAARIASRRGRQGEVGTVELLAGLASSESPVSRFLSKFGLTPETLTASTHEVHAEPAAALGVDFDIQWQEPAEADRTGALRILDAAANRAREGLRVVEDYARFALDDAHLTERLKECRHALRDALAGLPLAELLRARETQADVGTRISTASETIRSGPSDVARAAFKRVEEAVRSLEEFSKLWSSAAAERLERLRYELYTLEKALLLTEHNRHALAGRRLCLLATGSLCRGTLESAVRAALAGGVGIVQIREKELPERQQIEHARRVQAWCRAAGAPCIFNDRADLAVAADADGVHLGQEDLAVKEARAIVGTRRLIGVSTHTIDQARQAVLDGADYIGVGPVFPSATKSFESLAGLEFVRQVADEITLPWFAIGGINGENLDAVLAAGARRIAVSHAILSARDPETAARDLFERLSATSNAE